MQSRGRGPQVSDSQLHDSHKIGSFIKKTTDIPARYIECEKSQYVVNHHLAHHRRGAVIAVQALAVTGLIGGVALNSAIDRRADNLIPEVTVTELPITGEISDNDADDACLDGEKLSVANHRDNGKDDVGECAPANASVTEIPGD